MEEAMLTAGALKGVKVLDLSRLLPGPYCSMILADHGADVIAIEDSRFKQDGLFFSEINRNKRHMSLNLKSEKGVDIFHELVLTADVVLEGFRPGVVQRLGVDYETLRKLNPHLIYCSITGYGQTGPKRDEVGHDVNYLSTAGVLDLIGGRESEPTIPAVQIADIAGGSMQAAVGILLALYARERTGAGQYIDISMTDGILGFLTLPRFFEQQRGEKPARSDMTLSHRYGCYNTYRTKDNRFLTIGAVENRFWKKLCEHLDAPQYISLQYDRENRFEIIQWLRQTFILKSLAEWEEELSGLDVCFSSIATLDEVMNSQLFKEREMVCEYQTEDGKLEKTFGIPVKLSETPGTIRAAPCTFGEHTREVLQDLGYGDSRIDEFIETGVV
jgi:crotonobetainyl-CoA:carnitine CoA-transferase CaiB-like acyl-CoA transferase